MREVSHLIVMQFSLRFACFGLPERAKDLVKYADRPVIVLELFMVQVMIATIAKNIITAVLGKR